MAEIGESFFDPSGWLGKGIEIFIGTETQILKAEATALVSGVAYLQGTSVYFSCTPKPRTVYDPDGKRLVSVEVLESIIKKIKCEEDPKDPFETPILVCKLVSENLYNYIELGKIIPTAVNVMRAWKENGDFNSIVTKIPKIVCYCCKSWNDEVEKRGSRWVYRMDGKYCKAMLYTQTHLAHGRGAERIK